MLRKRRYRQPTLNSFVFTPKVDVAAPKSQPSRGRIIEGRRLRSSPEKGRGSWWNLGRQLFGIDINNMCSDRRNCGRSAGLRSLVALTDGMFNTHI